MGAKNETWPILRVWNTSHNIGGAIAGGVALWGANVFFHGNVIGMFIFPSVIALLIGIATLFIGKDDPEELGWNRAEEIWEEPVDKENIDSQGMTKWEIFKIYPGKSCYMDSMCFKRLCIHCTNRY